MKVFELHLSEALIPLIKLFKLGRQLASNLGLLEAMASR